MCQKIAIYKALIVSHGHFVISAGGGGLVFKTTHEVEDSAYEVGDSLGGGRLCTWHRSLVLNWKQLGTYTVHYNLKTDNLRSICKMLSPILGWVRLHFNVSDVPHKHSFYVILVFNGGPGKHPIKSDTIWWQNVYQHDSWNYITQPFIYTDKKDCFEIKFSFVQILTNTILIYTVSRILGNLRKIHFETAHYMTKIAFS